MAAPPAGELPIYASASKRLEYRVAVGLDYPALTAEFAEDFSGALDSRAWAYSWIASHPLVESSTCKFRSFGVPPWEWLRLREANWPDDPAQPFKITWHVRYPTADPVYSPVCLVGGLQQDAADGQEPLILYQQGSATTKAALGAPATEGDILAFSGGVTLSAITNDPDDGHDVSVEWDPAKAVNTHRFTVRVDAAVIAESDATARPEYVRFGMEWTPQIDRATDEVVEALGEATAPVVIMEISDFAVTELGTEGYESRTYPDWTSANDGGDLDTADPGERFSLDGFTWAKLPASNLTGSVARGSDTLEDRLDLTLLTDLAEGFADTRWQGMPVTVDTRVVSGAGTTAWRRQFAGLVTDATPQLSAGRAQIALRASALPQQKLDVFIDRAYRGDSSVNIPGVNVGYTMADIWADLVEVGDAVFGSPLGDTDVLIRDFDLLPSDIGTGGESMLPVLATLVDSTAHEYYCDYAVSGTGRYGRLRIHAGTLGSGTPDYTIPAGQVLSWDPVESGREGPTQAHYRQNLSVADPAGYYGIHHLPLPGTAPVAPYPSRGRVLSDSISFARSLQVTVLQLMRDRDNASVIGGIAQHRYRLESARRRQVSLELAPGHDWLEPSDEIAFSGVGQLAGETWVVTRIEQRLDGATRVTARTSDWYGAVRRGAA